MSRSIRDHGRVHDAVAVEIELHECRSGRRLIDHGGENCRILRDQIIYLARVESQGEIRKFWRHEGVHRRNEG